MDAVRTRISTNVRQVFERVAEAAGKYGRSAADISIVAVSKYVDVNMTRVLAECLEDFFQKQDSTVGFRPQLGESRPQLLESKVKNWGSGPAVDWHFIGPLQSNKLSKVVPLASLIHSVDRLDLLQKLDRYCAEQGLERLVLLEFNISGDQNKHGFTVDDLPAVQEAIHSLSSVRLQGLMGMSGLESDSSQARAEFESLAALLPKVRALSPVDRQDEFKTLSMGMSGDMEEAIAAGSTMVRVGSSFFEGVL